jgi:hypothetical protein
MKNIEQINTDDFKRGDTFVRSGNNDLFKIYSIDKTSTMGYVYITNSKGDTLRLSRLCLWSVIRK